MPSEGFMQSARSRLCAIQSLRKKEVESIKIDDRHIEDLSSFTVPLSQKRKDLSIQPELLTVDTSVCLTMDHSRCLKKGTLEWQLDNDLQHGNIDQAEKHSDKLLNFKYQNALLAAKKALSARSKNVHCARKKPFWSPNMDPGE